MKKIVIIISNELENNIPLFVVSCDELHRDAIGEFIFQNDISISLNETMSSQELSFALAEQGFCVLIGQEEYNVKNLIAFIPNRISPNQYEYFEKRKNGLKDYNFAFFACDGNSKYQLLDSTIFQGNILEEFFKVLNQKKILHNFKIKKRTIDD